jgi:hypothetical protein
MSKTTIMVLPIFLLLSGLGSAQNITGSLSGRVVDQQGASVVNASITVTEPARNVRIAVKTTAGGDFTVAGLLPGSYSIAVEAVGFKKLSRSGVALDANDKLAVGDLALEVGAVTESIEVTGTAALLQTESVERSATINGKQVENIEVNGRNALDMAKLVPGVQFTTGVTYAVGSSSNGANDFTVNGARPSQNQLSINGIGNVDTGNNGGMNVAVSIDSIAEFKILTGSYQAEYGRSAGGQINMVTKSGTEQFHGSGYWYHRNDGLNANSFINNVRGLPRPLFRYNDPGYTVGGPVYIPKLFERTRHKAFFFFSQEWQKQLSPNAAKNVLVPTALERKGDFSQSVNNNGAKLTFINDPLNQTPFPNMQVPANRIYAPGQALLNLFPQPNVTQVSNFNYTSQFPGQAPRRETLLRADYNLTERVRLFGHFIDNQQPTVAPYGSFVLGLTVPITQISNPIPGRSVAAGATFTISPTMTNEFNWGFTHNSILIAEAGTVLRTNTSGITLPREPRTGYGRCAFHQLQHHHRHQRQPDESLGKSHHQRRHLHAAQPQKPDFVCELQRQLQFRRQPVQPLRYRVRNLQRAARRLQHVQSGQQPHQRIVPVLEYRAVRPGHVENYASIDPGLRCARRLVSATVRFLAAGVYVCSERIQCGERSPSVPAGDNPGHDEREIGFRSGDQYLSAVL